MLVEALTASTRLKDSERIEKALWEAIDVGISNYSAKPEHLMIIINGLDEPHTGAQVSRDIKERLTSLAKKHKAVQLIILSEAPIAKEPGIQTLEITPDHTHNDMRQVLDHGLKGYVYYEEQSEFEQEAIVEQLLRHAKGSFLWASMTVRSLRQQTSCDDFMKLVKEGPKTVDDILQKILATIQSSKSDFKNVLSWLLVAERPLTQEKIKCLLRVDVQKKALIDHKTNIVKDLERLFKYLITAKDNFVTFCHGYVRSYLFKTLMEKKKILG